MEAIAERWALSSGLCDDLEGVVGEGGRSRRWDTCTQRGDSPPAESNIAL